MKKLWMVALVAALATGAFGQQADPGTGRDHGGFPGDGPRGFRERMIAKLNLTEDQQAQIEKMRIELEKKQVAVRSKIQLARLEMKELFNAASPDRAAIEKKIREVTDLQLQEKLNGLDHLFAVKAILTPEQQKLWKDHMKQAGPELRERMREWRGR